ncbi:MAG: hypothetical protein KJP10_02570 [Gammaproteobacteria bacterium]|nr:hypothetical protein [Gammaproteobacteria bacterium]
MNRQQLMFVETRGQVLNRLQASLFDTHADWQILFMADAFAALDLISRRKVGIVLAYFGMVNDGCDEFFRRLRKSAPELIRVGLLQRKPLMYRLVERGLIHPTPVTPWKQ